jgi:hypothetical protein
MIDLARNSSIFLLMLAMEYPEQKDTEIYLLILKRDE